jgi:hypothetical protein
MGSARCPSSLYGIVALFHFSSLYRAGHQGLLLLLQIEFFFHSLKVLHRLHAYGQGNVRGAMRGDKRQKRRMNKNAEVQK